MAKFASQIKRPAGAFFYSPSLRETLNQSTFYGEPAQLCDVGFSKIKGLSQ
jgi:hypothetical protein